MRSTPDTNFTCKNDAKLINIKYMFDYIPFENKSNNEKRYEALDKVVC